MDHTAARWDNEPVPVVVVRSVVDFVVHAVLATIRREFVARDV
jgi:hypothetical protein